jgi:hypothetical protein
MRCDDERIPGWVLVLAALALLLALAVGVTTTAHANPASTNVFLGRGATPVVFRSKTSSNTGSITPPTGAAVGDIVVVVMAQSNIGGVTLTSGGGAWSSFTIDGGGGNCGGSACSSAVLWRKLTAGDLPGPWTITSGLVMNPPCNVLDYVSNGATTLTRKEEEVNYSAGPVAFTGYTPSLNTRGALTVFYSSASPAGAPPTGFTLRDQTGGAGVFAYPNSADMLNYQSGGFSWTPAGYGGLLEFSGP